MTAAGQFSRYVVVGLVSNAVLYAGYLALTMAGMEPKLAMTVMFALGVMQTFVANRTWTFGHEGPRGASFVRYSLLYLSGYAINFAALALMVDGLGFPHQIVQAVMVGVVAVYLFILQKLWVFKAT